jgi:hypothetical protein
VVKPIISSDEKKFSFQKTLFYIPFGGGGAAADGQLHVIRSSSQTSSPHERK